MFSRKALLLLGTMSDIEKSKVTTETPSETQDSLPKKSLATDPGQTPDNPAEYPIFEVEIIVEKRGFAKIRARDKNHAKKAVEAMGRKKLLQHYKHRFDFIKIGEIKPLKEHD
jgi:hypothetical protein